ncbi:hypothetical protein BBBOND_0400020 [Babesia bigemina]|uniref:Uncharacterized protein n=1 Tax=Babesia bigemina TaxID=5866 RepID=A0A061D9W6_BABBI|nr:hypothetical protein BBBOND_0400020 [Babesia bigemina]CDR97506.1 hypothetical protein BBBOND_0400020 [Babesia bigemina]|eukprot:XP_012769692.1 hypothetical protein BBBOND_0400020 [Babesia bigemina]
MAFLSGVLEAVKNENEVTTYYSKMDKTLEKIKDSMHKTGGLSAAVEAVSEALGEWDGELDKKTSALKKSLEYLKTEKFNNMHDSLNKLNAVYGDSLSKVPVLLDACIADAGWISGAYDAAENEYENLDPTLRDKLKDALYKIKLQVKSFEAAAANTELKDVVDLAGSELLNLKQKVDERIDERMNDVKIRLGHEFKVQIHDPLNAVKKTLTSVDTDLKKWIDRATEIAKYGIEQSKAILKEVTEQSGTKKAGADAEKWRNVEKAALQLKQKAQKLYDAASTAKKSVERLVPEALSDVLKLDRAVRTGLKTTKDKIKGALRKYIKEQLLGTIMKQVKSIEGEREEEGLQGIMTKVAEYAKKFQIKGLNKGSFGEIVQEWVDDSLGEEPVKGWLTSYFEQRSRFNPPYDEWDSSGRDNEERTRKLAGIIVRQLENQISHAVSMAAHFTIEGSIQAYVDAVQTGCNEFAKNLGERIKSQTKNRLLASTIAGNIERAPDGLVMNGNTTSDQHLTFAVDAILHQLVGMAMKAGEAIDSFTVDATKMSTSVNDALKVVRSLWSNIDQATRESGIGVNAIYVDDVTEPYDLTQSVEGILLGILRNDFGLDSDGDGKVDTLVVKNFEDYDGLIKQATVPRITNDKFLGGDSTEGSLCNKIGEIKREVAGTHLIDVESGSTLDSGDRTDSTKFYSDSFGNMLTEVESRLADLMSTIKNLAENSNISEERDQRKGVKNYFEELQKMIQTEFGSEDNKHLDKIKERIEGILNTNSDGNLKDIVSKATQFKTEVIDKEAAAAIKSIKDFVDKQVADKIKNIQGQARTLYHSKISGIFKTMKTKVENYISNVSEITGEDSRTGVKGLLRKVMDHDRKGNDDTNMLKKLKNNASVKSLSSPLKAFLRPILTHVETEVKTADSTSSNKQENECSNKVNHIHSRVSALLRHFSNGNSKYNFDDTFVTSLLNLKSSLADLSAPRFSGYEHPLLLDSLKDGLMRLCEELDKSYVNTYSGQTIKWEEESNTDKTYCAKILVTIMKIFGDDLALLKHECENGWKESKISLLSQSGRYNHLGNFLRNCGYVVTKKDGSQNGELQCSAKMIGKSIVNKFGITVVSRYDSRLLMETLKLLVDHISDYYETCHLGTWQSKTYPSSVYDMLRWLSGFTHNGVYQALSFNGFEELFEKPEEDDTITLEADGITGTNLNALSLSAYPHDIKPSNLTAALTDVCNHSHAVLTTILGHGHGEGVYACEFDTNSAGLVYPADFNTMVCMIRDIINRLYGQLQFLYQQCKYDTALGGWLDCEYGQCVGGASWRCNVDQCVNLTCNQKGGQRANQNGNQKADQRCQEHPKCGVKSPLQSFLEDKLPGFLPHNLKSERGKLECSLKSHGNLPCITPMGFSGISQMASHRATGQRIVDVLAGYCGTHTSPLTRICGLFNCILPSAPKTLSDMFGFYYSFLYEWDQKSNRNNKRIENRETAFKSKVSEADFENRSTKLDITSMFGSTDHKSKTVETSHLTGDLYSLVCCNPSTNSAQPCGAYLRPLCYDTCTMFSKEHADKYLSWIVYLTETFYTALQKLLEDCRKTCGADARKCKIGKCKKDCGTKEHPLAPSANHNGSCGSIVECGYIRPTFFRYGFTHDNVASLSGVSGDSHKRTCTDFCAALRIVTKEGNALYDIVNKTIPEFLWTIRQKFFWTTVALWSLSLLYLICVMVGRLDVLHIRSHLRSPSSHRIAAQSLLAAAQVGRLAKISYLQP